MDEADTPAADTAEAPPLTPIAIACDIVGSQAKMAAGLGVSAPTVNQWMKEQRPIPQEQAPDIERLCGGAVLAEQLCPKPRGRWTRIPDESWPHPDGRPVIDPARPAVQQEARHAPV
jgi:DNA-binding transcriptional regulator YdaS (Cro superfamily)